MSGGTTGEGGDGGEGGVAGEVGLWASGPTIHVERGLKERERETKRGSEERHGSGMQRWRRLGPKAWLVAETDGAQAAMAGWLEERKEERERKREKGKRATAARFGPGGGAELWALSSGGHQATAMASLRANGLGAAMAAGSQGDQTAEEDGETGSDGPLVLVAGKQAIDHLLINYFNC